jgi:hypothetical protein
MVHFYQDLVANNLYLNLMKLHPHLEELMVLMEQSKLHRMSWLLLQMQSYRHLHLSYRLHLLHLNSCELLIK